MELPKEQKRKPKKVKEPFWKKYGPELQSISKHIGKTAENMKFNDWADLLIMGTLGYISYETFKTVKPAVPGHWVEETPPSEPGAGAVYPLVRYWVPDQPEEISHDLKNAIIGPLGYKLATTMGGTPPVSQIAGLAILSALGVAYVTPAVIVTTTQAGADAICRELEKWADGIVRSIGL